MSLERRRQRVRGAGSTPTMKQLAPTHPASRLAAQRARSVRTRRERHTPRLHHGNSLLH